MRTYNLEELRSQGLTGVIKQEDRGEVWKLIEKRNGEYIFWLFVYTVGISDFSLKNMKRKGEVIPKKHWEWRHVEDVKTLKEAKQLFNN